MVCEGPLTDTLSITSGYKVPWAKKAAPGMRLHSFSKTSTKVFPMIFFFAQDQLRFEVALKKSARIYYLN